MTPDRPDRPAKLRNVTVFCGANRGAHPRHASLARALGAACARRGIGVVYGGGNVGLMGVLADAVLDRGGTLIGVIPARLAEAELAHRGATEMHVVDTMHARKALMTARCDAFVALPGGLGTMDETFEALTWRQLGYHDKPVFVLDPSDYYRSLLLQLDRFVDEGFLAPANRGLLERCATLGALFERLDPFPAAAGEREYFFHLTTDAAWRAALDESEYCGDTLESEGFIHTSTRGQLAAVANRRFRGRGDLVLLAIDAARVAARVVRENLEGGADPFPHLYGPLNLDAVVAATSYRPAADGAFGPPPEPAPARAAAIEVA